MVVSINNNSACEVQKKVTIVQDMLTKCHFFSPLLLSELDALQLKKYLEGSGVF